MTFPSPTRLFWRVMRGKHVHSTWATPGDAQRMADRLNTETNDPFHVEAWS